MAVPPQQPNKEAMWIALSVTLTIFALAGAWSDAWTDRIPNRLVLAGIAAALVLRAGLGWVAVFHGLAAGLIALAIGLPLFALRAFGGGDVKFMAMCAVFVGLPDMQPVMQMRLGWSLKTQAGATFNENAVNLRRVEWIDSGAAGGAGIPANAKVLVAI